MQDPALSLVPRSAPQISSLAGGVASGAPTLPSPPTSASPVSLEGRNLSDIPEELLQAENPDEKIRLWKLIQTGGTETRTSVVDRVFAPFQKSEQIAASAFKYLANIPDKGKRDSAGKDFVEGVKTLFNPTKTFVPNDDYFTWVEAMGEVKEKINQSGIPDFLGSLSHTVPAMEGLRQITGTTGKEFDRAMGKLAVSNALDTLAVLDTVFLNPDNAVGTRVLRFGDRLDALKLKDGTALTPRGEKELGRFIQKIKSNRPGLGLDEVRDLAEKQLLLNISRGKEGFVDVGGVTFLGKQFETSKFTHKIAEKIFDIPLAGPAVQKTGKFVGKVFNKYSGLDHGTEAYFRKVDDAQHAFNQLGERQIEMLSRGIPGKEFTKLTEMLDSGSWHLADGSKAVNKFGDTQQDVLIGFDKFFRDIYQLEKQHGVEIESLKNYVPLVLKDPKKADEFLEIISRLPSQNDPFSAHRQLSSLAEAKNLGLEWDIRKLAQIRLRAASKAIAHRKLLGGLSEQLAHQSPGLVTPDSFKFYNRSVPLPDSPQGLANASKEVSEFPDDIKAAIKTFDRLDLKTELLRSPDMPKQVMGQIIAGTDAIHNFFKNNVTVLFPTFHTRNSLSNVVLNFYDIGGEVFRLDNHKLVGDVFGVLRERKGKTLFRTTKSKTLGQLVDQTEQGEARKYLRGLQTNERAGVPLQKELDAALSAEEARVLKDLEEIGFYPDNITLQRIVSRTDAWEKAYQGPAGAQKISKEVKSANKILKQGAKSKDADKAVALTDRFGTTYTINEIADLAEKHHVFTDWKKLTDNTGDNFLNDTFGKRAGTMWGGSKSLAGKPFEVGRRAGTRVENEGRLLNFIANLRRGHSPQEAALRTKKFLFDYGGLAPVEREFFARIIPFYSFGRYNTALTADMLMRAPGRLAAPLRFAKGMTEQLSGIDPQDRPEWAPSYLGERGFYLNTNMKPNGRHRFITSTGAPMEDINRYMDIYRDPMGSVFPTIKWLGRVVTGDLKAETFKRDVITGRPGEFNNLAPDSFAVLANLPDPVKKFIGFDERLVMSPGGDQFKQTYLNPYLLEVIRNLGFSRGPITADKVFDTSLPWADRIGAILSPVSFKSLDPEEEAAKKATFQSRTAKKAKRAFKESFQKDGEAAYGREELQNARDAAKKRGMTLREYLAEQNKPTTGKSVLPDAED